MESRLRIIPKYLALRFTVTTLRSPVAFLEQNGGLVHDVVELILDKAVHACLQFLNRCLIAHIGIKGFLNRRSKY